MKLLLLLVNLLINNILTDEIKSSVINDEWLKFKTIYRPNGYNIDINEESMRRQIFELNYRLIVSHNREADEGLQTYRLGVNEFTDWTDDEYANSLTLKLGSFADQEIQSSDQQYVDTITLPQSVDWRDKHVVTPVKDQKDCSACFAFSAIDTIESQLAIKTGKLEKLSVQQILDCGNGLPDNLKSLICFIGGLMHESYEYIIKNGGIESEERYPYIDNYGNCSYRSIYKKATIGGYVNLTVGSEDALQHAVSTVGPIAAGINSSPKTFKLYKSGVYNDVQCLNGRKNLSHAVVVVGYGVENGQNYWLIKNSWNTTWGDQGYIKLARNANNTCGIATYALYPTGVHP
ncbi:procathepsin L-like [Oppia nitens]|uniref:procathepsin L-like n=1 Tax=Oppia nitens TaxID=1686743 RepID=UPI0023D983A9|nr:procathepsin L-like [Oppia nitens]